jgi:FtsH-binding integral membrane protein
VSPDVVRAVDDLASQGLLPATIAPRLRRIAAGELISVRRELEVLLYFGVALVVAGVGLLVKENLDRVGPLTVAVAIGAAALGCLVWCWRNVTNKGLAFEYVLTLGALLVAADLAFIEVKFTPLGQNWPWHLAIVAAFYSVLAVKFDSRSVFGLALSAFAAWRGVSLERVATTWNLEGRIFVEAVFCGALFIVIGKLLERVRGKAHFEPVAWWIGSLILMAALFFRMQEPPGRSVVAASLLAAGVFLAWLAWDERRIGRFALGVGGAGLGLCGLAWRTLDSIHAPDETAPLALAIVAAAVVVVVLRGHRALRAKA